MSIFTLIHNLLEKLFEAEYRRLNSVISSLNQRNKQLRRVKVDGFLYGGQFYIPRDATLRSAGAVAKTPLDTSLVPEMEQHLHDDKLVDSEREFIQQMLHILLKHCRSEQEIRDVLPECLVGCVPGLSALARRQEAAYTIQDNPRALRQYEKILPKMEFYSAAKLLY